MDDGRWEPQTFSSSTPGSALLVPPGYWKVLRGFARGTVVGVLASEEYDEADYIRDRVGAHCSTYAWWL